MKKKIVSTLLAGLMILSSFSTGVFAEEATEDYGEVTIENGERTITFTEMPTGILCCYSGEVLMQLGLEDYIIGTSTNNKGRISPIEGVAEKFEGIPEIERSHENAVASGADLIIGEVSAFQEDRWGTYDMLEEKGITGYALTGTVVEDETMDSIYQDIENMGKIFKVEDRAEELIADTKEQIAAIEEAVSGVAQDDKVKAFVMDSVSGNEVYTTSAGLESNLIELAGGINTTKGMADSRWFTTSVETIVTANPDVMIFNDYGNEEMLQESLDFINNNEALADVPAVANQNYIIIPLAYAMHDLSSVIACETFAEAFYPELFE
ncbi:MAG: ABC transporter substrate-binding protein [Lachnospiraceae bacterium]|nr:ABC transporter substrate-binding protein [Lachnospiraceae bacterium]